jgi:hypothetical protein
MSYSYRDQLIMNIIFLCLFIKSPQKKTNLLNVNIIFILTQTNSPCDVVFLFSEEWNEIVCYNLKENHFKEHCTCLL